jgi:hypothetical protein
VKSLKRVHLVQISSSKHHFDHALIKVITTRRADLQSRVKLHGTIILASNNHQIGGYPSERNGSQRISRLG